MSGKSDRPPRIRVNTYADLVRVLHSQGAVTKSGILKSLAAAEEVIFQRGGEEAQMELLKLREAIRAARTLPDDQKRSSDDAGSEA